MKVLPWFLIALFVMCGFCFAADSTVAPERPSKMTSILMGAISGLAVALTGYLARPKSADGKNEPFNAYKFGFLVLIGAAVGGFAGYKHTDFYDAWEGVEKAGAVSLIAVLAKLLFRQSPIDPAEIFNVFRRPDPPKPADPKQ